MTDRWTEQQLQYFVRVRDGLLKTGFSPEDAEQHAIRTVQQRIAQGEPRRHSDEPTKDDLYLEAKRYNITGRSKMDKEQLERAVARHRERSGGGDR